MLRGIYCLFGTLIFQPIFAARLLARQTGSVVAPTTAANVTSQGRVKSQAGAPNPVCLADTGRRCWPGGTPCEQGVTCSDVHRCVCPSWGCADAAGVCRPVYNKWAGVELRIAPTTAPHEFLRMPTDGKSPPTLSHGWPADTDSEGLWKLFVEPDNTSVLLGTKQSWYQNHSYFVDLGHASLEENGAFTFQQSQPMDALQAAWGLVFLPRGRIAVRHMRTGRYMSYDKQTGILSSCESPHCPSESADFDFWPEIDNGQEQVCSTCETPYYMPGKQMPGQFPWYLKPEKAWRGHRGNASAEKPWYLKEPKRF